MPARPQSHADEIKQIGNAAEPGLANNDVADGWLADSYSYKLIDLGGLVVYHDDEPPKDRFLPRPSVARMGYPIKHLARRRGLAAEPWNRLPVSSELAPCDSRQLSLLRFFNKRYLELVRWARAARVHTPAIPVIGYLGERPRSQIFHTQQRARLERCYRPMMPLSSLMKPQIVLPERGKIARMHAKSKVARESFNLAETIL